MTKEEYGEVRNTFVAALRALREVEVEFVDTAFAVSDPDHIADLPYALDEYGAWLTGVEYDDLKYAIALMERLVGRATLAAA